MEDFLKDIAPTTISLIATGIISLIIGVYLERFKNKLTFIKYNLFFQPLATSNQNEYWGNIEVFYNGKETNHLNFISIILNNDSNKDFQNINVEIWVDKDSSINGQNGFYSDSKKIIYLHQNHYENLLEVVKKNEEATHKKASDPEYTIPIQLQKEIDYFQTNTIFHLPVLNRKSEIRFDILVENDNGEQPNLGIDIKHKGLKLIKGYEKFEEEKKLGIGTIIYGILVFLITALTLLFYFPNSLKPIIILGIVGFFNLIIGLFVYRSIQFIKNYLI